MAKHRTAKPDCPFVQNMSPSSCANMDSPLSSWSSEVNSISLKMKSTSAPTTSGVWLSQSKPSIDESGYSNTWNYFQFLLSERERIFTSSINIIWLNSETMPVNEV